VATILIVALAAAWTTRTTIVTAIRDLDDPPPGPARLRDLYRALWNPPGAASGLHARESPAWRRERRTRAAGRILAEATRRGPLLLLAGSAGLVSAAAQPAPRQQGLVAVDGAGLRTGAVMLLIAGAGLLLRWAAAALPVPSQLTSRLAITAIGAGWLLYGLAAGRGFLRAVFVPDLAAAGITHTGPYSLLEILLDLLAPLAGLLIMTIRNADLPAALITAAARRIPALAPVSRTSLAHALTYRVRAGVTVTLLSTVTFLIMLLVSNDSNASTHAEASAGPYTAVLAAYLTTYLSLGMIFGVLAIGIIASRAVVERRQEIGTLRAIGFSRALVRRSFVLETSYITALGLLPVTGLAWWLVTRVTRLPGQHASLPLMPAALLLAGGWLAALAATILPARTAARSRPPRHCAASNPPRHSCPAIHEEQPMTSYSPPAPRTMPLGRRSRLRAGVPLFITMVAVAAVAAGCSGGGTPAPAHAPAATGTSASSSVAPDGGKGAGLPGAGGPQIYWSTLRQQLAQGLHRSVADLTALWGAAAPSGPKGAAAPAGTTLLDIAIENGMSPSRLRSLELTAITRACAVLVQSGALTRQQASDRQRLISGWGASDLSGYAMYAFQQH
jgi:hypothetical protein